MPLFVLLVTLSAASCRTTERYIATASPIDAIGVSQLALCVAVDPGNVQGVWWWRPGRSGCSTRSSSIVQGQVAKVTVLASGNIEASFQLPMQVGEPRKVELVFSAGTVQASATGVSVRSERRTALDMPEKP
jgi:hypothetical protein